MGAVQGDVLDDEVALADDMVQLQSRGAEVTLDGLQDPAQPVTTLGTRGVVDHVDRHQLVQDRLVMVALALDRAPRRPRGRCAKRCWSRLPPTRESRNGSRQRGVRRATGRVPAGSRQGL